MSAVVESSGSVRGAGLRIHWREWAGPAADGMPLVLLHGITGSGADWDAVARPLASARRVVALDARGHGASEWSATVEYTGDAHFADVLVGLEALGIERCALAGYSMGGSVAIMAAAAAPGVVQRLIVLDSYPEPVMTPGSRRIAGVIAAAFGGQHAASPDDRPPFDPAIARRIADDLAAGADRRLDLWPLWDALECPALLLRGEWSDVLPEALAREMCRRHRGSRLETIPGVAHQLPFIRPGETAAAIEAFLADS